MKYTIALLALMIIYSSCQKKSTLLLPTDISQTNSIPTPVPPIDVYDWCSVDTIYAIGDSYTAAGYLDYDNGEKNYPQLLAEQSHKVVINLGYGGKTSTEIRDIVTKMPNIRRHPFIVEVGTNSAWGDTDVIRKDIDSIISFMQSDRFLVMGLMMQVYGEVSWKGDKNDVNHGMMNWYRQNYNDRMTERYGRKFVDILRISQYYADTTQADQIAVKVHNTQSPSQSNPDGIHPNYPFFKNLVKYIMNFSWEPNCELRKK